MLKVFVASTDIADISKEIALSSYRKRKIDATINPIAKRERKAASVLLSYALAKCFGLDEGSLEYAEEDLGKPYIPAHPDVHFSISHTDEYCAVAVSDAPVGVDIQHIKGELSHGMLAIAKKYFNECDIDALSTEPARFFRLWTAMESAVKCTGEGISAGIRRFVFLDRFEKFSCNDMFFTALDSEGYSMTVSSVNDEAPSCEHISASDILRGNE